jgi:hypothetical protein
VLWCAGCGTLTPRGQTSCATSGAPMGTGSGADCFRHVSPCSLPLSPPRCPSIAGGGAPLTLPRPWSRRRHRGQTSASTRRSSRAQTRWRQWGGRCSSEKRLLRSMSRPRAISSNSSAMLSIDGPAPPGRMENRNLQYSSRERSAGRGVRESYRSCPGGGIAGRGAGGARRAQC